MATQAYAAPSAYRADQGFFVRLAWVLAAVIVIGFAQNAAMGRVNIPVVPAWVHLHALLMLSWLALLVTQNRLAAGGNLALHRRLGWAGAFLVCAIVGLTCFTGAMSLALHRYPPFFTPSYFLALTLIDSLAFGGLIFAGISNRRDTQAHRRFMLGGTIAILEPALGRLLPAPLLGGEMTEWIAMVIQLGFVLAIARHDRRTLGRVHPATVSVGIVVALAHVTVTLVARSPSVIALAGRMAGQG